VSVVSHCSGDERVRVLLKLINKQQLQLDLPAGQIQIKNQRDLIRTDNLLIAVPTLVADYYLKDSYVFDSSYWVTTNSIKGKNLKGVLDLVALIDQSDYLVMFADHQPQIAGMINLF